MNFTKSFWLLNLLFLSIIFGSGFWFGTHSANFRSVPGASVESPSLKSANGDDLVKALVDENAKLREELVRLSYRNTLTDDYYGAEKISDNSQLEIVKNELELERATAYGKKVGDFFSQPDSLEKWNKTLDEKFQSEPLNYSWADQEKQKISNLFIDNKNLSNLALLDVQCRSKTCAVTVAATSVDQSNEVLETFSKTLTESGLSKNVLAAADIPKNITKLYFSRDGQSFEFGDYKK